jgi:hypothetical protein
MKFSEIRSLNFHLEDCGGAKWKCLVHKLFPGPVETEAHYLPPTCLLFDSPVRGATGYRTSWYKTHKTIGG